jgi:hypothetical protein
METVIGLCNELGVPLAKNKTVGPTNILPFLGYIIDTELMMVLIPFEKIKKLSRLLQLLLVRKKIKRSELESIVGLMSFCSRAIPSSRAFHRRFYDLITTGKITFHRIRLLSEVRSDIRLWMLFLEEFKGQCYFPDRLWISNEALQLYTDASGNTDLGCAAFPNGRWAQSV